MNAYPEKPIVPYHPTPVNRTELTAALQHTTAGNLIKRMAYVILRNESRNGEAILNNNPCGFQADTGRWPAQYDTAINGVVQHKENGTGKTRLFLSFTSLSAAIEMLCGRLQARGMYEGGYSHKIAKLTPGTIQSNMDKDVQDAIIKQLCRVYIKEWVTGSGKAEPTGMQLASFKSMYRQALSIFP